MKTKRKQQHLLGLVPHSKIGRIHITSIRRGNTLPIHKLPRFPLAGWIILSISGKDEGSGFDQWALRLPLPDARIITYTRERAQVQLWKQFGAK